MGNHAIHAVPVIEGKIDVTDKCKYGKTQLAGLYINMFMLKLISESNVFPKGAIITKEDLMFEKNLYEVTSNLHKSFVQYGYQNPVEILSEESSNENSYLRFLPSELVKNVQACLQYKQVNRLLFYKEYKNI